MNLIYPKKLLAKIKRADEDYLLIEKGDKIGVGISGGKDSLVLLYVLYFYQKMVSDYKPFEFVGIFVDLGFPNMETKNMIKYFKNMGIEIIIKDSHAKEILNFTKKKDKICCSMCSKIKKAACIEAAKELGCNKVAFGHHADDAIETLLLNMIYGGKIATFLPKMYLDRSEITFIRPLIYLKELEVKNLSDKLELPIIPLTCPNEKNTMREEMKKTLQDIYKKYPTSRTNFILMLHNQEQLELWKKIESNS